jgi:IclR family transcriptional regulator, KDG regulon repressor
MPERVNPSYLKVVAKTFRVIETLSQVKTGMPLSELARRVKQPKATVFRIVFTLKQLGYVEQDPRSEAYRLSQQLGWQTRNDARGTLIATARPYLQRILGRFEQTVCLGVLDQDQILYVEILEGLRSIRMAATANAYAPVHSTSLGKSILAFLKPSEAEAILKRRPLSKLTAETITSTAVLMRHLAQVRKRGYAVDNEETERGARCVGVPIYGDRGTPFAAISVSGPISHIGGERVPEIARFLKKACGEISRQIGFASDLSQPVPGERGTTA